MNKRLLIYDGASTPYTVLYSNKYNKEELEEIIDYIYEIKKEIFKQTPFLKSICTHISSYEFANFFKLLGVTSWEIEDENLANEYKKYFKVGKIVMNSIFDMLERDIDLPKQFLDKYEVIRVNQICVKSLNYYKNKYKSLDFSGIKTIFENELEEKIKHMCGNKICRLDYINYKILNKLNGIETDTINLDLMILGNLYESYDKDINKETIKKAEDNIKSFNNYYRVYINMLKNYLGIES